MTNAELQNRPRYAPEERFPPYSYVPGRFPHPLRDPEGHSYGSPVETPKVPDPDSWRQCRRYLHGIDLFNHGYYWEAHEVWEGLWHACGRKGAAADFLKGLIKLAAAGVKVREGKPQGVRSHARRAAELFAQATWQSGGKTCFFGLKPAELIERADAAAHGRCIRDTADERPVAVVFDFVLLPGDDEQ